MKKFDQLYFLAIIPPEPIKSELLEIKDSFSRKFNCKAALNSPPHITLHMPFRFPEKKEDQLMESLNKVNFQSTFEISLENFGCFEPKVIYINVTPVEELNLLFNLIQRTMKSLSVFNAGYKNRGFNPHLTIAFRDLKKLIFPVAWEEYNNKSYTATFENNGFYLLKHNGKSWDEYHNFIRK